MRIWIQFRQSAEMAGASANANFDASHVIFKDILTGFDPTVEFMTSAFSICGIL